MLKKNGSFAFCRFLCQKGLVARSDFYYCALIYLRHRYLALSLWDLHNLIFRRLFFGVELERLALLVEEFLDYRLSHLWYAPAVARARSYQNAGVDCWILSNSPSFLVAPIARRLGIEKVFSTEYQCNEKGELVAISLLMDGPKKAGIIACKNPTVAYSDSHLDFAFLDQADRAVAVKPNGKLRKIAKKRGWEIL